MANVYSVHEVHRDFPCFCTYRAGFGLLSCLEKVGSGLFHIKIFDSRR